MHGKTSMTIDDVFPAFGSAPKCRGKGGCSRNATHRVTFERNGVSRTGDVCEMHAEPPTGWRLVRAMTVVVLPEPAAPEKGRKA